MPTRHRALWALAVILSLALLIAPALWNGFALLHWDSGGYLARWYEGTLEASRAVVYGLILTASVPLSFWPVLLLQAAATLWLVALTLRVHGLGKRPLLLLGIIAALSVTTTLPWLTAILLTDIFAGLGVLALYLLLLRADAISRGERLGLIALIALSAATHNATLAVLLGLLAAAAVLWLIDRRRMPLVRLGRGLLALVLGAVLLLSADFIVAKRLAWTPGGFTFLFGRMLQDGIVKKYLDQHCPHPALQLCAYKDQLPDNTDMWFWGSDLFDKLGRFAGLGQEMEKIALDSVIEYPALQARTALVATARATDRRAYRRRCACDALAHLRHRGKIHAAARPRYAHGAPAAKRDVVHRYQQTALSARADRDGTAAGHRGTGLAQDNSRRDRRTRRHHHARAAGQCFRVRRVVQSERPLRRAHGLARDLRRRTYPSTRL